jgi:tungstate transport system substrate-binding protein
MSAHSKKSFFMIRFVFICTASLTGACLAWGQSITLASTTSTEQSGLFAHLLPALKQATNIDVKLIAVGTGQALDMGRRGDADLLIVHDPAAEEKFVREGFGLKRWPLMHNDFVLIGSSADPAKAEGTDIALALQRIAQANALFISRGDKSGTHAAELRYWAKAIAHVPDRGAAAYAPTPPPPSLSPASPGAGYRACGCGMGQALNMAASTQAYVLADRGTWLSFKNRMSLKILVQGDQALFNPYGLIAVNPARHPHTQAATAQKALAWLLSAAGQARIASYKINGEPLFFPNAKP